MLNHFQGCNIKATHWKNSLPLETVVHHRVHFIIFFTSYEYKNFIMSTTVNKQVAVTRSSDTTQRLMIVIVALIISLRSARASDPTVIFLSGAGARQLSSSNLAGSSGSQALPFTIQTIGRGDTVERKSDQSSSSSSSSSGGGLYSLASVIRERLGERMQDRSSAKKGPRIIVIPASTGQQSSNQQQQQQQSPRMPAYNNYMSAPSGYPGYASPYVSSTGYMASASSPYAQYAFPYPSPYIYSLGSASMPSSPSSSQSTSRYSTAESAPFASYAHPAASPASLLGSIFPSNIGSILKYPYTSLYPYLAQAVAHTLYGASANNNF